MSLSVDFVIEISMYDDLYCGILTIFQVMFYILQHHRISKRKLQTRKIIFGSYVSQPITSLSPSNLCGMFLQSKSGGYGGMHTSGYEDTLAWSRFVSLMAKFHFGVYSFKITLSHIHMSAITYIMIWILL